MVRDVVPWHGAKLYPLHGTRGRCRAYQGRGGSCAGMTRSKTEVAPCPTHLRGGGAPRRGERWRWAASPPNPREAFAEALGVSWGVPLQPTHAGHGVLLLF